MRENRLNIAYVGLALTALTIAILALSGSSVAALEFEGKDSAKAKDYIEVEIMDDNTGIVQVLDPKTGHLQVTLYDSEENSYQIITFHEKKSRDSNSEAIAEKSLTECAAIATAVCGAGNVDTVSYEESIASSTCTFSCD